jgi:coatomer protein complex subunit gamma
VSDHIQKILKPNFAAAWEEVGDAFEKEETFALSSTKTLEGKNFAAMGCLEPV